jgi:dCTP diphosphatase
VTDKLTATTPRSRLAEQILAFSDERDRSQFHTPKNLAAALVVGANELLALFQWARGHELDERCTEKREEIEHEIADVYIYLLFLVHSLGIDLDVAGEKKMGVNAEQYPVQKEKGTAKRPLESQPCPKARVPSRAGEASLPRSPMPSPIRTAACTDMGHSQRELGRTVLFPWNLPDSGISRQ